MSTIHRNVTYTTDRYGDPVAAVEFSEDELRGLAAALGPHDGGSIELTNIADELAHR